MYSTTPRVSSGAGTGWTAFFTPGISWPWPLPRRGAPLRAGRRLETLRDYATGKLKGKKTKAL
mgnify:CR=1 FL=1